AASGACLMAASLINRNPKTSSPGPCPALYGVLVGAGVFLFVGSALAAQSAFVWEKSGPATLLVNLPVGKDGISCALSDLVTITLEVDGPKTLEVKPPDNITSSPGWRLAGSSPAAAREVGDERSWRQTYTLEPLLPGGLSLQIEPLLVRTGSGDFRKLTWRP